LKKNAATSKYQVATFGGLAAASYITGSDLSVLAIGGFSGTDPSPTLAQFEKLVASGQLKYVVGADIVGMGGGMAPGSSSAVQTNESASSQIDTWVSTNCQTEEYLGDSGATTDTSNAPPAFFGNDQNPILYSCKN
jgi:hypothetical protein